MFSFLFFLLSLHVIVSSTFVVNKLIHILIVLEVLIAVVQSI